MKSVQDHWPAGDDAVLNARHERIEAIADVASGDSALFLGTSGGLICGEPADIDLNT